MEYQDSVPSAEYHYYHINAAEGQTLDVVVTQDLATIDLDVVRTTLERERLCESVSERC